MGNLFNPDAFLWRWCSRLLDVMILSVLWFFCSIPLITGGAAYAALYDAAVHGIRRNEPETYARFFRTFRAELKTASLTTLLWGAIFVALLIGWRVMCAVAQTVRPMLAAAAVYYVLMAFVLGVVSWVFPLLSRFELDFRALNRTALQLFVAHLPSSIALAFFLALSAEVCAKVIFPIFFLPCTEALIASLFLERAFRKHMPAETQEEET